MSKNVSFHSMSKHIDVRYHEVKDVPESKSLELAKIYIDQNVSDMISNVVTKDKYLFCRSRVGMVGASHAG